ncbi:MAG: glycosyltransferase family 4 protein [Acidilobaceae archaeon]
MRIGLVMDWHPSSTGGVQSHVRYLAQWLSRRGHEVVLVSRRIGARHDDSISTLESLEVDSVLPIESLFVPPNPISLREVLSNQRFDVIHSHHIFTLLPLMGLKVAWSLGVPRVITNHTLFFFHDSSIWNMISYLTPTKYYLRYAQTVISVSQEARKFVENIIGDRTNVKHVVIPNGVDSEKYSPPEREPEENRIVFVGRLVHRKGVHVLISAIPQILNEVRDLEVVIVGEGYMKTVANLLSKLIGVSKRVKLLGWLPESEKIKVLKNSKVAVAPSIYNECFGITAIEAMAVGRPVVASRVGGLKEVVEHGVTGLLVSPGSKKELVEAVTLLLQDEKLRREMGRRARETVEKKYSWNVVVEDIIKVYDEVMSETRSRGF